MREIKIRYTFKHIETGEIEKRMYTLTQLEERNVKQLSHCFDKNYGYELIGRDEYTGVNDKNDDEIYENDVIKVNKLTFKSSGKLPENLIVKYYDGKFQLFRGDECLMGLHLGYVDDGEVIGSIYEQEYVQ